MALHMGIHHTLRLLPVQLTELLQDIISSWGTTVKGNKIKVRTAIIWKKKKKGFNLS
jgi:hypothetical protein